MAFSTKKKQLMTKAMNNTEVQLFLRVKISCSSSSSNLRHGFRSSLMIVWAGLVMWRWLSMARRGLSNEHRIPAKWEKQNRGFQNGDTVLCTDAHRLVTSGTVQCVYMPCEYVAMFIWHNVITSCAFILYYHVRLLWVFFKCHFMLCHVRLWYIVQLLPWCYDVYVTICHVMSCHAILCHIMSGQVMWCHMKLSSNLYMF